TTDSVQIFKEITAAYTTLIDESKRRAYDDTLAPQLEGWEADSSKEHTEKQEREEKFREKKGSSVYAWGTFGNVRPTHTDPSILSAEEAKALRPALYQTRGILGRLLWLIGF